MSILDRFRLDGRTAVVTGAGKGIGKAIAVGLAEAGADVAVTARSQADLESTAEQIRALGRRCLVEAVDVTKPGALEALAKRTQAELGNVAVWVNNAGGLPDGTPRYLTRTSLPQWQAQIDLNFTAVWQGCIAAAGVMESGAIINVSSRAARGGPGTKKNGPYAASKAAVNTLTSTLAVELAPKIRVNAVAPGPIATENFIVSTNATPERQAEFAKGITLQRLGTPEDIAAAVIFLASDASGWMTGECIYVTGG